MDPVAGVAQSVQCQVPLTVTCALGCGISRCRQLLIHERSPPARQVPGRSGTGHGRLVLEDDASGKDNQAWIQLLPKCLKVKVTSIR